MEKSIPASTIDSKLTWSIHVANSINKANKALHAIRLIKKFFTHQEILQLLNANFYSILYYNSEIWHLPMLKHELKQHLLSASARALKISLKNPDPLVSFIDVHHLCKIKLPSRVLEFKHAILLHKIYNTQIPQMDWIELTFNQSITSRETLFNTVKTNRTKIGNNIITTRLSVINRKIKLEDLNLSINAFKFKYKQIFAPAQMSWVQVCDFYQMNFIPPKNNSENLSNYINHL